MSAKEHDHDHDDFGDHDLENDALWLQDHLQLVSVGIDIGSSGTQVIFSRVQLRRLEHDNNRADALRGAEFREEEFPELQKVRTAGLES